MLGQEMLNRLNEQINLEAYSANLYLAMGSWCEFKGLNGAADFLYKHSDEEMDHMKRLFKYVNETGAQALIGALNKPESDFTDLKEVMEKTLEHEKLVTRSINNLVDFALTNKDHATFNFLQWYVAEQHEEEALFKSILDKINIIGVSGHGLFMIDKEIASLK